jgi:hypothetical protein
MRFYARHTKPNYFRTESDKKNWIACENALKDFSDEDRELLLTIYREGDTIPDNVYQLAKEKHIKQDTLWKLISELEHRVAKRRGLV